MLLQGKRIYIIEDNVLNRAVYQIALTMQGALVEFDRTGGDGCAKVVRFNPDLIILDLMLPKGQSGFQLFDEIKQVPQISQIPVVAVSASEPALAIPQAQRMGFNGYIAKPINEELFARQILDVLNGKEVWVSAGRYAY